MEPSTSSVPSPCTRVCQLDRSGRFCLGCLRSIDEIARWTGLDDAERREVLRRTEERRRAAGRDGD